MQHDSFPYKPPSNELRKKYSYFYDQSKIIKRRRIKRLIDVILGLIGCIIIIPILCIIKILYVVEGMILPWNSGPMFYFYWSMSGGRKIKKWKLRQTKLMYIDPRGPATNEWRYFKSEWEEEALTVVGKIVKNFYLDELPQLFSILKGDMSFVGPRPLSLEHYERDLAQGNITRKMLQGGLLGFGHVRKGTDEFGDPRFEFEYADTYANGSNTELLILDLWILFEGIKVVLRGGGH